MTTPVTIEDIYKLFHRSQEEADHLLLKTIAVLQNPKLKEIADNDDFKPVT